MRGHMMFALAALVTQAALAQPLAPAGPGATKLAELRTLKVAVTGGGSVGWQGGGCAPKAGQSSAICTAPMLKGRTVDVVAKAPAGTRLDAWSGACEGKASCKVVMNADQDLVATFMPDLYRMRVAGPAGTSMTLSPPGAQPSCGAEPQYGRECHAFFAPGSQVNVFASPLPAGSQLLGPGCPSGSTRCRVTVSNDVDLCVRPPGNQQGFNFGGAVGGGSGLPPGGCRIK